MTKNSSVHGISSYVHLRLQGCRLYFCKRIPVRVWRSWRLDYSLDFAGVTTQAVLPSQSFAAD
jgi:hypothetical protein